MARIIICKDCGEEKKHHAKGLCGKCYRHQYYLDNRKRILAHNRDWEIENRERRNTSRRRRYREVPEKYRAKSQRWRKRNPEKVKEQNYRYYWQNPDKNIARVQRWQEDNKQRYHAYCREWQQKNPEQVKLQHALRRSRERRLPITLDGKESKRRLLTLPCFYCGKRTNLGLDHFVPLARKENKACGTTLANSVVACKSCNSKKHTKMPKEILSQLSFGEAQLEAPNHKLGPLNENLLC